MNSKEVWIDDVMNSLDGMQPAQAPMHMRTRVLSAIQKASKPTIPLALSWSLAAGLLLLISLNVVSIVYVQQEQKAAALSEASKAVATEYFSSITN